MFIRRKKSLRRKSPKMVIIEKINALLREDIKRERGSICQVCGKHGAVGMFHVLPVSRYPRLRFCKENILLVCWFPCHYDWHHNYYKARKIEERIREILGEDYEDRLEALDVMMPKLTLHQLNMIHTGYMVMNGLL